MHERIISCSVGTCINWSGSKVRTNPSVEEAFEGLLAGTPFLPLGTVAPPTGGKLRAP